MLEIEQLNVVPCVLLPAVFNDRYCQIFNILFPSSKMVTFHLLPKFKSSGTIPVHPLHHSLPSKRLINE